MNLKEAAVHIRQALKQRVFGFQGRTLTFFDNFLLKVFHELATTEDEHHWNLDPTGTEGENRKKLQLLNELSARQDHGRFVAHEIRKQHGATVSILQPGGMAMTMSTGTTTALSWKGTALFKTAYDLAILPMLLWELKPRTIFEIGSGMGTSAQWMADTSRMLGLDAQIYSVDIQPISAEYPGVKYFSGNCMSPETLFTPELLQTAPHPWLVLEDAHANVAAVLDYIDRSLIVGDYLIVEDSLIKGRDIERFLKGRSDKYLVDSLYTDFFGHNATCANDSIFRRVK